MRRLHPKMTVMMMVGNAVDHAIFIVVGFTVSRNVINSAGVLVAIGARLCLCRYMIYDNVNGVSLTQ